MIEVEVEVEEATEIAEALGLRRKGAAKRKSKRRDNRSCEDCFFHRRMLCALDPDEPCATFRPNHPDGLRPPKQMRFVFRQERRRQAAWAFPDAEQQALLHA